jgi:hypothetical protein
MYAAAGANNLNGGGGGHSRRQVLSSVDFYRRVPKDLTEVRYIHTYIKMFILNIFNNCHVYGSHLS